MRTYFKITITLLFSSTIIFMGYNVICKINHIKEVAEYIKIIPPFSYKTTMGKVFSNADLKDDRLTIFLYFNSECEHCQIEAQQIQKNVKKLSSMHLILISIENPKKIIDFADKYKLDQYSNITFLYDSKVSFASTFDIKSIPTMLIYDKDQKLIEKINGQIKVEQLLEKLNSNKK